MSKRSHHLVYSISRSFTLKDIPQRVCRGVEHPIQPKLDLVYTLLDECAGLRVKAHAPAFKKDNVYRPRDRRPFRFRKPITFAIKQTFIKSWNAYIIGLSVIYLLERLKK